MDEYKYKGLELTPNVFTELLILYFDGKQFKRNNAIDTIVQCHKEKGGILEKKEYVSVFKKACRKLSARGLSNIGYGIWRLNYQVNEVEIIQEESSEEMKTYKADLILGEGEKSVYVYYYDTYRNYAENKGLSVWECKIGRTDKDPLQRVFGQAGTCYPELPHIALILKCDDSSQLEAAIHNILKCRKKWIESAPGTEWFITSPQEVQELYSMITGE